MKEYLFYSILALVFTVSLYVRLSNIDMTQTRLFIEFWYVWLSVSVAIVLDYLLLGRSL
jgi:ABC-type uncharacterized transport system involved in gliding motility auxiliary subunit